MQFIKFSLKRFLLIYIVAELLAFILVSKAIGVTLAIILLVATCIIGTTLLKRKYLNILSAMKQAQQNHVMAQIVLNDMDGMDTLSCILLIIPGFLTDIAALLLFIPLIRRKLHQRFAKPGYRQEGGNIIEGEYTKTTDTDEQIKHEDHDSGNDSKF